MSMYACNRGLFGASQRSITARSMGHLVPLWPHTTHGPLGTVGVLCAITGVAHGDRAPSHLAPQLALTKSHGMKVDLCLHVHGDRVLVWFLIATPFFASR